MKRGQTWPAQLSEREFDRYNQGSITEKISLNFASLLLFVSK